MALPTQSIGGLVSGFDTASIVESLMKIERRPVQNLENKVKQLEAERQAYMSVNRLLLDFKSHADSLGRTQNFDSKTATSSNESLLSVTAYDSASAGTHTFRAVRQAQSHQLLSTGFDDPKTTPVGAGTIRIDQAGASLRQYTSLKALNAGRGIYRGALEITDRAGNTATVDVSTAENVQDVLDAINNAGGIDVQAGLNNAGTALEISDTSGGAGNLVVQSANGGLTAEDLGIDTGAGGVGPGPLSGEDIFYVGGTTSLASLRDGRGIDDGTLGSIQLVDSTDTYTVDLSDANSIGDVVEAINSAGDGTVFQAEATTKGLRVTHLGGDTFDIEDDPSDPYDQTATDLGIAGSSTGDTLSGANLIGGMNTVMLDTLTGANGGALAAAYGEIEITDRAGNNAVLDLNLTGATSLDQVVTELNTQAGGAGLQITASLNDSGDGVVIEDTSGATASNLIIQDTADGTQTATNLNLTLDAAIDRYNGGPVERFGIDRGSIDITDQAGNTQTIDLSGAETLQDILDTINNAAGVQVEASINDAGNGIAVQDLSGGSAGNLVIANSGGSTTATTLGIEADTARTEVDGGDLDRQYISRATKLDDLNGGKGVAEGSIRIIDGYGTSAVGDLSGLKTVGEVIAAINSAGLGVTASVNQTGDGIMVRNRWGNGTTRIEEVDGGSTAADLGLLGSATAGDALDGSYEAEIEIDDNDTLSDVAYKVGMADLGITASVMDDGSGVNANHLVLSSQQAGTDGLMVLDSDIAGFSFGDLSKAQDALMLTGGGTGVSPVLLTSSSNTFDGAVPGLSINLEGADPDTPVTITVDQDTESITESAKKMVESYNNLNDLVNVLTRKDEDVPAESEDIEAIRGMLLGDTNLNNLMSQVSDGLMGVVDNVPGNLYGLYDLGITFEYNEEKKQTYLELDQSKLNQALESNFEGVRDLLVRSTDYARSDRNGSMNVSAAGGAARTDLRTFDEGNDGTSGSNNFSDNTSLWGITNAMLGENTDADGNLYIQARQLGANNWDILAYKDAAMNPADLVASARGVDAETGSAETFNLVEENSSGLSLTAATDGDLAHLDEVTVSNLDNETTDPWNLINGNTDGNDFGGTNGFVTRDRIDDLGSVEFNLSLDNARPIYQLAIHHIDTADEPAEEYALRDFTVEYFDTVKNSWQTARTYTGNRAALNYVSLPDGARTNQVRINATGTNAPDGRARLVEIEAFEREGVAAKLRSDMNQLTDSRTGIFATLDDNIDTRIRDLEDTIADKEQLMEQKEISLLREFAAMEEAMARMQQQGDFFTQQMASLQGSGEK